MAYGNLVDPINETLYIDDEDYSLLDDDEELFTDGPNVMLYVYAIIFVVGLLDNLWVLFLIGKSRQAKTITNIFIFNLGVADLFLMLCLPIIMMNMVIGQWIFGVFLCKLYFAFDGINKFASVAFLVLLSLDRYLAVCHPLTSRNFRTPKSAFILVAITWSIVVMLMVPVFVLATVYQPDISGVNQTKLVCSFPVESENGTQYTQARRIFTFYTFTLSYLLPLIMISIFYLLIVYRLRRQEKLFPGANEKHSTLSKASSRRKRSSRQISIMVAMIVAAYTFCWLPYWFLQIGLELFPDKLVELSGFRMFSFIAYGLQISNSALNPFLYALGTDTHRRDIVSFIRKIFHCSKTHSPHSVTVGLSTGEQTTLLDRNVKHINDGFRFTKKIKKSSSNVETVKKPLKTASMSSVQAFSVSGYESDVVNL